MIRDRSLVRQFGTTNQIKRCLDKLDKVVAAIKEEVDSNSFIFSGMIR